MVEQIEDYILSGSCKSIKNWDMTKHYFCDAAATLLAHKISAEMCHASQWTEHPLP